MARTESTMLPLGTVAPDFNLLTPAGTAFGRKDFEGKPLLVMFICNHCPFVKHLADHLARFTTDIQRKGVGVIAINSNDVENYPDDAPIKMVEEIENRGYTFPYVFDESQDVAKAYRAACTPDFYLFDRDHRLTYRGQYDSSRPGGGTPTGEDLEKAIEAVLNHQPAPEEQRPSMGCNIKWKAGNAPEYFGPSS
ncbi:MAG: thioredoxin family protein [Myxococcota bacterium]